MAYGKKCPSCGGMVDSNEFNFLKGICKEGAEEHEQEEIRRLEVARIMNSKLNQINRGGMVRNGY